MSRENVNVTAPTLCMTTPTGVCGIDLDGPHVIKSAVCSHDSGTANRAPTAGSHCRRHCGSHCRRVSASAIAQTSGYSAVAHPNVKPLSAARKVPTRVVSVPCFELFFALPEAERNAVVGAAKINVAVEAGIRQGWDAIIGSAGGFVGMSNFGASAPYKDLYRHFGLAAEKVAEVALNKL